MLVRPMLKSDAAAVAALCAQLGYTASAPEIEHRLSLVADDPDHGTYVAQGTGGRLIGWVHVHGRLLLQSAPFAEIGGLVVDAGHRRHGVARALIARAEEWALLQGYSEVHVRSNAVRAGAHDFYRQMGYQLTKSQHVFVKPVTHTESKAGPALSARPRP